MTIPAKKRNLDPINEHLTCCLCSGYLIDAWTINECLHSFCRACIFSYFNDNDENTTCPTCSAIPHPGNPLLGITKDCWLQQLVYKLVPSLFKREMCQRRTFYDANPESRSKFIEQYMKTYSSQMGCREEELGELSERCLFQQKNKFYDQEKIFMTLEYNDQELKTDEKQLYFLECSSHMPIKILKQYLKKVLPLSKRTHYHIDVLFDQKVLLDSFTLIHIYSWRNTKPEKHKQLHLFYRVIITERQVDETIESEAQDRSILPPVTSQIVQSKSSRDQETDTLVCKPPAFVRSVNLSDNPNSFVHTTPFTPAEARTISLNHTIMEQMPSCETMELIKPKECRLIDCKTFTTSTPISYSMDSISDISKTKKRPKKSNTSEQSSAKKCKVEKKKKVKEEKSVIPLQTSNTPIVPVGKPRSENENPNDISEQKQLSYSEVIQEANKLLAADEPMTPTNNSSSSSSLPPLANAVTARLTKPIATVSPLHTSKNSNPRVPDTSEADQLIDLSKSNTTLHSSSNDVSSKMETKTADNQLPEPPQERKKRARQTSSSTTRTKVSRHSNKSANNDDGNDTSKSFKKTMSNMNPTQYLPPPTPQHQHQQQQQQQHQQMFQNFFHSFQNQANYWPMSPWPVPPSLAMMADPRSYYPQAWPPAPHPPPSPSMHAPKDLSSVSLNDFIGESMPVSSASHFPLPAPSSAGALLNSASNFPRTSSTHSLHLHHAPNRHRPATLNGTLS